MSQVFNNILVVQDAYRDTVDAMEWASQMVSPSGSIKIMDVQPPFNEFWLALFNQEFESTPVFHRKKRLSELAKRINFPTTHVKAQVRRGTPVVEIVRETLGGRFDLVIKETFDQASDLIFGSLDMRLMRYCPTPVWMVNPEMGATCDRVLVALNPEADEKEMLLNKRLLDYAAKVAMGFGCTLLVVAAHHSHSTLYPALDRESITRVEQHSKTARRNAHETLEGLLSNSPIKINPNDVILEDGWPSEVILDAVNKVRPDLLVMGSVARHGLTGLLVGNAAERVLRKVNCSILTIKPADFICPIAIDEPNGDIPATGRLAF